MKHSETYRVRVYDERYALVEEIDCGDRRQDALDCGGAVPLQPGQRAAVVEDTHDKSTLIGMRHS